MANSGIRLEDSCPIHLQCKGKQMRAMRWLFFAGLGAVLTACPGGENTGLQISIPGIDGAVR